MKGKSFMKLKLRNSFYLRVCTNCPSRFWNHGRIKKNPLGFPLNTNSAPIMLYGPVEKLEMSSSAVLGVFYSVALQFAELSPLPKGNIFKNMVYVHGIQVQFCHTDKFCHGKVRAFGAPITGPMRTVPKKQPPVIHLAPTSPPLHCPSLHNLLPCGDIT